MRGIRVVLLTGMAFLVGARASLACLPLMPEEWTAATADGAYSLRGQPGNDRSKTGSVAFLENVGGESRELWSLPYHLHEHELVLSPGGEYVAIVRPYSWGEEVGRVEILDRTGTRFGPWSIVDALSGEEKLNLGWSSCGLEWLASARFEGSALIVEVVQGGNRRPTQPPGPRLAVAIELPAGTLTRPPPPPHPELHELIERFRAASGAARQEALRQLSVRTTLARPDKVPMLRRALPPGEPESGPEAGVLAAFWESLLQDPASGQDEIELAVQRLVFLGPEDVLVRLMDRAGQSVEIDGSLLEMPGHLPGFSRMAESVYRRGASPGKLRARALGRWLASEKGPASEILDEALRDPEPEVRTEAITGFNVWKHTLGWERLVPLLGDPDAQVAETARRTFIYRCLRHPTQSHEVRPRFLAMLEAGEVGGWPEALLILGSSVQAEGDLARARRLLEEGLRKSATTSRDLGTKAELISRLAVNAFLRGEPAEARSLALRLAELSPRVQVCTPSGPSLDAGEPGRCRNQASPQGISSLLLEAFGHGKTH